MTPAVGKDVGDGVGAGVDNGVASVSVKVIRLRWRKEYHR